MSYGTYTATYTVVDIRKAFEGFEADLRMIARRTDKWSTEYVDKLVHDVIKLAEAKYLSKVSIALKNSAGTPLQATKFVVNESGTAISGDRAGSNDWSNITGTHLSVTVEYTTAWHTLGLDKQNEFEKALKFTWTPSTTDTNFPNLTQQGAQNYASNGYEVKKYNYK
jgi:hypothetical protein